MNKSFLCLIGIHKWSKPRFHSIVSSNVRDYQKTCQRCGKVKRWSTPRTFSDDD